MYIKFLIFGNCCSKCYASIKISIRWKVTNASSIYAGGIGYFSANGDFDTCIALRTAISKNKKFYVQSGAGIVADSKPINEFNETVNKAKALLKALE